MTALRIAVINIKSRQFEAKKKHTLPVDPPVKDEHALCGRVN